MLLPAERLIRYERLVAPNEHLGILIEPSAERIRPGPPVEIGAAAGGAEFPVAALRAGLRDELELRGPVILAGHQPEFFHAGVLAKNIAAAAIAEQTGGTAIFLAVDTDVPKSTVLRLAEETAAGLRRVEVPIPGLDTQRPYAAQPRTPRDRWLAFFAQVGALHRPVGDSQLGVFAKAWIKNGGATPDYCEAFAFARHATEAQLGIAPLRAVRETDLSRTAAFRAFFAHIALHAGRFAASYNAAQAAYRARHKVRARGRPVPPLRATDGRVELPFWVVPPGTADAPRMRLFVEWRGTQACFQAEDRPAFECSRAALETGRDAAPQGWSVWPRALALSTFARLLLADLFIHGIGGAKYDEVSEDFARTFFGVEPAPACCVTATLHLPLPHSSLSPGDARAARRASRDVRFNPQRYVRRAPTELLARRSELIRRSDELRSRRSRARDERRLVFREIRRVNAQILDADPWCAAHLDQRIEVIDAQLALDRIALDREYFYALHPATNLRALRDKLVSACMSAAPDTGGRAPR